MIHLDLKETLLEIHECNLIQITELFEQINTYREDKGVLCRIENLQSGLIIINKLYVCVLTASNKL